MPSPTPNCATCKGTRFVLQELPVEDSPYRLKAIYCAGCGSILAVHELLNVGDLVFQLADKLGIEVLDERQADDALRSAEGPGIRWV